MLRKFFFREDGTAMVLVALAMSVLLGFMALTVDCGVLYAEKQKIQAALDAACLAGVQDLPDTTAAVETALYYAELNGLSADEVEVSFENGDRRMVLTCTRTVELIFMPSLGVDSKDIGVLAAAEAGSSPGHVFDYTLFSGSTSTTLRMSGNDLLVDGSAHTNENFRANGNDLEITGACEAVGTISTNGNNIDIPLRYPASCHIDMPDYSDIIYSQAEAAGQVFNNDVHYNGNNVYVDNSIYVDGDVHMNGNTIRGAGAILSTGDIHINGNCISANTDAQVCVYSEGDIHINGNNITIEGILYAPYGEISMNGNNIIISGRVIANEVRFSGNDISITGDDCSVISLPGEGSCHLVI